MSTMGGPGWPNPPISQDPNVNLARGVDLSALKDKQKHQHRWVVVARFIQPDKIVAKMAENVLRVQRAAEKGQELELAPVGIPMGDGNMSSIEGPGCSKCGQHWQQAYGQLCQVSDDAMQPEVREAYDMVNAAVIEEPEEEVQAPPSLQVIDGDRS